MIVRANRVGLPGTPWGQGLKPLSAAGGLALLVCLGWSGETMAAAEAQGQVIEWACEVVYLPARQVWSRQVRLVHDERHLTEVFVDGLPVYSFAVEGTWVWTSLDNERIQLDAETMTWRSDFRGQATGQGRCSEG